MKKITKVVLIVVLGGVVGAFALFMLLVDWLGSSSKVDTGIVRREWKESVLANSSYFDWQEITTKAEKDRIYLRVSNVEPEVIYVCTPSSLSKYCQVKVDKVDQDGYKMDLSTYFWDKHRAEIERILVKYSGRLDKWTDVQIRVYYNDIGAATDFMKELLEIPDFQRLYRAYQEKNTGATSLDAQVTFDKFWFDFHAGNSKYSDREKRYSLFELALEQGL